MPMMCADETSVDWEKNVNVEEEEEKEKEKIETRQAATSKKKYVNDRIENFVSSQQQQQQQPKKNQCYARNMTINIILANLTQWLISK